MCIVFFLSAKTVLLHKEHVIPLNRYAADPEDLAPGNRAREYPMKGFHPFSVVHCHGEQIFWQILTSLRTRYWFSLPVDIRSSENLRTQSSQ